MTEPERVDCADCFALAGPDNTRIAHVKTRGGISETWHTPDCPALAITQINMEGGSKRVREQDAWAPGRLPRCARAAQEGRGRDAQSFVDALGELVQAQADTTGIVVLHRWAEILERHFPPELPGPDHTTE